MLKKEVKYSYDDISVVPAGVSKINHRSECNPYVENGNLPLFTAPMNSVISIENFDLWEKNNINAILPRTVDVNTRLDWAVNKEVWVAFSLQEFNKFFIEESIIPKGKVLIDIANGHMESLYRSVEKAKAINPNLIVMVGNIANPETYHRATKAGVDYIRVGIGSGKGCVTSSNVSVHFPMASLISEIVEVRESMKIFTHYQKFPKIVADGGVRGYNHVIKALALGADYVMVGSVFTKMIESASPISMKNEEGNWETIEYSPRTLKYEDGKFYQYHDIDMKWKEVELRKEYYGMASKKGQLAMNGIKTRTSEGLSTTLPVTYTMEAWVENMTDYLRSAMSYTNSKTLNDLKQANCIINSPATINSINK